VSLLYGARQDLFLAALVLGLQLRPVTTRRKVLLLGPPLPEDRQKWHREGRIRALEQIGWEIKHVDLISAPQSTRYGLLHYVMTKLRLFEVFPDGTEVLFLDLDILIQDVGEIDEMFKMASPAAKYHGEGPYWGGHWEQGQEVPAQIFFRCGTCINAGVMRLRTDYALFDRLMKALPSFKHGCALPEQYFLCSWPKDQYHPFFYRWWNMKSEWNLEVDHRLQYLVVDKGKSGKESERSERQDRQRKLEDEASTTDTCDGGDRSPCTDSTFVAHDEKESPAMRHQSSAMRLVATPNHQCASSDRTTTTTRERAFTSTSTSSTSQSGSSRTTNLLFSHEKHQTIASSVGTRELGSEAREHSEVSEHSDHRPTTTRSRSRINKLSSFKERGNLQLHILEWIVDSETWHPGYHYGDAYKPLEEPVILHFSATQFKPWYFVGLDADKFDQLTRKCWEAPEYLHVEVNTENSHIVEFAQQAVALWLQLLDDVRCETDGWIDSDAKREVQEARKDLELNAVKMYKSKCSETVTGKERSGYNFRKI